MVVWSSFTSQLWTSSLHRCRRSWWSPTSLFDACQSPILGSLPKLCLSIHSTVTTRLCFETSKNVKHYLKKQKDGAQILRITYVSSVKFLPDVLVDVSALVRSIVLSRCQTERLQTSLDPGGLGLLVLSLLGGLPGLLCGLFLSLTLLIALINQSLLLIFESLTLVFLLNHFCAISVLDLYLFK